MTDHDPLAARAPPPDSGGVTSEVAAILERNYRYLDSMAGKNELHCGPLMLNHALIESTELIERLWTCVDPWHSDDHLRKVAPSPSAEQQMLEKQFAGRTSPKGSSVEDHTFAESALTNSYASVLWIGPGHRGRVLGIYRTNCLHPLSDRYQIEEDAYQCLGASPYKDIVFYCRACGARLKLL